MTDTKLNIEQIKSGTADFLLGYDGSGDPIEIDPATLNTTNGLTLLATASASASTSVDFTSNIDSTYEEYELHIIDMIPATDGADLYLRTSTDAGASFDTGASDYGWARMNLLDTGTAPGGSKSSGDTKINLVSNIGSAAGESTNVVLKLFNPAGINSTLVQWLISMRTSAASTYVGIGAGARVSAADVDAIRFIMSAGNITSGQFKLYGVTK